MLQSSAQSLGKSLGTTEETSLLMVIGKVEEGGEQVRRGREGKVGKDKSQIQERKKKKKKGEKR